VGNSPGRTGRQSTFFIMQRQRYRYVSRRQIFAGLLGLIGLVVLILCVLYHTQTNAANLIALDISTNAQLDQRDWWGVRPTSWRGISLLPVDLPADHEKEDTEGMYIHLLGFISTDSTI
jgi:hypothetical protein